MTITLDVPQSTQMRLEEQAREAGLALPDFVLRIITERVSADDEWLQTLSSGHIDAGVSLSDEQTSRETIYQDGA